MRLKHARRQVIFLGHALLVGRRELRLLVKRIVSAAKQQVSGASSRATRQLNSLVSGRKQSLLVCDSSRPRFGDLDHQARLELRARICDPGPDVLSEHDNSLSEDPHGQSDNLMQDLDLGLRRRRVSRRSTFGAEATHRFRLNKMTCTAVHELAKVVKPELELMLLEPLRQLVEIIEQDIELVFACGSGQRMTSGQVMSSDSPARDASPP